MGAVRMEAQTADKKHYNNPQEIQTTTVHKLTS